MYDAPANSIQVLQLCKTLQPGSFSKLQDDLVPIHYCVSCIRCPFNTVSSTRWLCWPSRVAAAPLHRRTSVVTSRLASVNGHFTRLQWHYWTSRSPGQTSRDELFVVLRQLNGTRWLTHCLYLNLGLRRTSSVRLLSNTHDWPAASASEPRPWALYKSDYYNIIIMTAKILRVYVYRIKSDY